MICQKCQKEIADGSNFCYFCGASTAPAAPPAAAPAYGEPRRWLRSVTDRKLGGVCAGLANYLDIDVSVVRVIAVVLVIPYGIGLWAYLAAWIIIPEGDAVPGTQPAMVPSRRLHRSAHDRKIGGVCGGMAEFLEADPSIIRIIWLVLTFVSCGLGLVLYLLLWLVLPLGDVRPAGMQHAS